MSAGLDSIAATELANVLVKRLGTELPQTVLFDHPTIGAVASFAAGAAGSLANELSGDLLAQAASICPANEAIWDLTPKVASALLPN